jgi:hypothetical protein
VLKALDRRHGRFAAFKIRPSRDGHAREELLGEARILQAISPHPVLPLVREDCFENGSYVVAMDWVDRIDLGTPLADRGRPLSAESRSARFPSASDSRRPRICVVPRQRKRHSARPGPIRCIGTTSPDTNSRSARARRSSLSQ